MLSRLKFIQGFISVEEIHKFWDHFQPPISEECQISFGFLQDTANKQTNVVEFQVEIDITDGDPPTFDPVLNPTFVDVVA